jgi:IPT/TIG domain
VANADGPGPEVGDVANDAHIIESELALGALPFFDDLSFPASASTSGSLYRSREVSRGASPPQPRLTGATPARPSSALLRRHSLVVAVMVVAVAVVLAGGAAAGLALTASTLPSPAAPSHPNQSPPSPNARSTTSGSSSTSGSTGASGGASGPTKASTSGPPASSGAGSARTPGGAPQLSSVRPVAGASGQTLTLSGSGLYSSTGLITAYVGGAAAPTSCSSQTTCTVTIPDLGGPHRTTLVVKTSSGASNSLAFDYT